MLFSAAKIPDFGMPHLFSIFLFLVIWGAGGGEVSALCFVTR